MGNRIFVGVVVVLWAGTMSWLMVARILPPFFHGDPPVAFGVDWRSAVPFYYLILFWAVLSYLVVVYVSRSPFGLALQGIRDNPRRMAALGFNVTAHRIAAYAFAAFVLASPLGLLLALLPKPAYSFYEHVPRLWGLTPLADQEIAGVTMASEQALVLFVVFLYWFRRFLAEEGAT